jgi:hypothetical protein
MRYLLLILLLCAFSPAQSPVYSPVKSPVFSTEVVIEEDAGASYPAMEDELASNLLAYWYAEDYISGQTWENLETTPADSSSENEWDCQLGANTDDTSGFNGGDDPIHDVLHWDFHSEERFFKCPALPTTGISDDFHKDATDFTFAAAFRFGSELPVTNQHVGIVGNGDNDANTWRIFYLESQDCLRMGRTGDGASLAQCLFYGIELDTDYIMVMRKDGQNSEILLCSSDCATDFVDGGDIAMGTNGTESDATQALALWQTDGLAGDADQGFTSGGKVYASAFFNYDMPDADADTLREDWVNNYSWFGDTDTHPDIGDIVTCLQVDMDHSNWIGLDDTRIILDNSGIDETTSLDANGGQSITSCGDLPDNEYGTNSVFNANDGPYQAAPWEPDNNPQFNAPHWSTNGSSGLDVWIKFGSARELTDIGLALDNLSTYGLPDTITFKVGQTGDTLSFSSGPSDSGDYVTSSGSDRAYLWTGF